MEHEQDLPFEVWELIASHLSYRDAIPLLKTSTLHRKAVEASCTRFDDREELHLPLSHLRFAFLSRSPQEIVKNIIFRLRRISELQLMKGIGLSSILYQQIQPLKFLTRLECIASAQDPMFSSDLPLAAPNLAYLRLNMSDSHISRVPCLKSLRTLHIDDITHISVAHFGRVFAGLTNLEDLSISSISSSDFDIGPLVQLLPPSLRRLAAITPNDQHTIDFADFQRSLISLRLDCAWFDLSNAEHATSLTSLELSGPCQHFGFLGVLSTQLVNLQYNFQSMNDTAYRSFAFCRNWPLWPFIRSLDFSNSRIRNVEYSELQRLSLLTKLGITNCRGVDAHGIETTPRTLKEFHVSGIGYVGNEVWGGVFAHTGLHPSQIETLSISSNSDLFLLRILPRTLRNLDISRYSVIGAAFSSLPMTLTRLTVSASAVRSPEYAMLAKSCPKLKVLEIAVISDVWTQYSNHSTSNQSPFLSETEDLRKAVANRLKHIEYVQIVQSRL